METLRKLSTLAVYDNQLSTRELPKILQDEVSKLYLCCKGYCIPDIVQISIERDHVDCFKKIYQRIHPHQQTVIDWCCKYDSINCLIYVDQLFRDKYSLADAVKKLKDLDEFSELCANNYSKKCLKFCFENGASPSSLVLRRTIENFDEESALIALNYKCPLEKVHSRAAVTNLDMLKLLVSYGCPIDENLLKICVRDRLLDCIDYCIDVLKLEPKEDDLVDEELDLETLKYLVEEKKFPVNSTVIAMSSRSISCLKFLHKQMHLSMDGKTVEYAIMFDNINSLKYAIANKCPVNPDVLNRSKSLAILKYLVEQNCHFNESTLETFATRLDLFDYAFKAGAPVKKDLMEKIVTGGNNEVILYAMKVNVPYTENCLNLLRQLYHDFTIFVYDGCPCDPEDVSKCEQMETRFALLKNKKIVVGRRNYIRTKYHNEIEYEGLCYDTKAVFIKRLENNAKMELKILLEENDSTKLKTLLKQLNEPKRVVCRERRQISITDLNSGVKITCKKRKNGNSDTCSRGFINQLQQMYQEETGTYLNQKGFVVFPQNKQIFNEIVKRLLG